MILIITILIIILIVLNYNTLYNFSYKIIKNSGLGDIVLDKLNTYNIVPNQSEIIPNLWIGNYKSALNKDFLTKNNIKLIINCSKTLEFTDLQNIIKIRLSVNDDRKNISDHNMIKLFPTVYNTIDNNLSNNNGILIHCKAGMQRSATITALYLMKKNNIHFSQVKKIIRKKRNIVFRPFTNFIKTITFFENNKFNNIK
jgi:protein-tyrosine phosphatase